MSLRILQLINRVPWPLKDGGSIGYYNYIKGYADAGCQVTVAALNTSKHFVDMDSLPDDVKQIAEWHTVFCDNKVRPVDAFLNLFSNKSYNIQRFIVDEFEMLLKKLLTENTYDVIVFESLFMAPYLEAVKKFSGALLVLRQHNAEYKIWQTLADNQRNPVKKWYLNLLSKRLNDYETAVLNKFDCVTTVTQNDADDFKQMGCFKPLFVSATGIDVSRLFVSPGAPEQQSVFHIGSMEWQPNVDAMQWFIDNVWNNVAVKNNYARFYVAGRGMPDFFEQYNSSSVKIVGEVDDAVSFMQSKQIMIVPLFAGSGIRIKILEGMALGKAIITTTLGAQGINAEHTKNILIADTADEFCQCVDQLLNNNLLCETLGAEARKLIEQQYANEAVISRLLVFYRQNIQKKTTYFFKT